MPRPQSRDVIKEACRWQPPGVSPGAWLVLSLTLVLSASGVAHADNLEAPPGAPWWAHVGAAALLYLHIGGGALGMASGVVALATRKGGRLHRRAGAVFFASMLVTYAIGAGVAPFLAEGQRPNFVAGIMALYLLVSGWMTVRRPAGRAGALEVMGLVIALAIACLGALFMRMGAMSPTGTIDGSPPQAFILFTVAGALAACGELNVLLRRGISGVARIARATSGGCASRCSSPPAPFFSGRCRFCPPGCGTRRCHICSRSRRSGRCSSGWSPSA